jgi:hypothetical protein
MIQFKIAHLRDPGTPWAQTCSEDTIFQGLSYLNDTLPIRLNLVAVNGIEVTYVSNLSSQQLDFECITAMADDDILPVIERAVRETNGRYLGLCLVRKT